MAQCNCPASGCAKCSVDTSTAFGSAVSSAGSTIGTVAGAVGSAITFAGLIAAGTITFGLGVIAGGVVGALAVIGIIIIKGVDTCTAGKNDRVRECVAGVVNSITPSFNSASDEIFPFTASQNELDLVVKSEYWPIVEKSNAFVWCNTDIATDPDTDNSEVVRCYFFTPAVCNAVYGSIVGAVVGGTAAVIVLAVIVGIIGVGCATFFGCLLALLIAAIIAAVAALAGAFVGGQIGKNATSGSNTTTSAGDINTISVGDLISCTGPLIVRGDDSGANVFWWVTSFSLSGTMLSTPKPFRYCDVDANFPMDACNMP